MKKTMYKINNKLSRLFLLSLFVLLLLVVFLNVSEANIWSSFFGKSSGIKALPHGGCNSCHVTHNSPGGTITAVKGNANLCMSCHNPTGSASAMPFTNAMSAIPGTSGNSHAWNKLSVNPTYETNLTTDSEMLSRVINDTIICSTCHNQHSQTYTPFLRASNNNDSLCKNCHAVRDIKRFADNTNNKGSHPVGISYPSSDTRFFSSPQDSTILIDSSVECSSCHSVHYAATNDGYILRQTNDDNLCKGCHTYTGHQGMGCSKCHQTHNTDKTNIYLVKSNVSTPSSGIKPVILSDTSGVNSYADGDATYNGVCEVCHTATKYHRNNAGGDHTHYASMNCITCHPHENSFLHGGSGDCRECHGHDAGYEYQTGLYCQGKGTVQSHSTHTEIDTDDQIGPNINCEACHDTSNFPYFKSGTDSNGDSKFDLSETDVCNNCHSSGGLFDGVNDSIIGAKNNWTDGIYSGNNLRVGKDNWCAGCHDANQASSNQDGSGILAPDVAGDSTAYGYYYSGHGKNLMVKCVNCHNPRLRHLDGNARTYTYADSIANLDGTQYRTGYRLIQINGLEPMRIPLNDPLITQLDSANFRLCLSCHNWNSLIDSTTSFSTNFNHSGPNAPYSFGYGVATERNDHLHNHLDFQAHGRVEPYWDSDWDFNTTAIVPGSPNPEINGYDSFITCVTCHDVHGGKIFGGNTGGNMMRDGRLQGREPGLKFTYMIEAPGGLPQVTSVGANEENSIGGVIRSGVDYRAGYNGTESNAICGGCHKEVYPTTDEYNATGNASNGCTPCHPFSTSSNYYMEYYRTPTCVSCHYTIPEYSTDAHQTHIDKYGYACSICHFNYGSGGSSEPIHPSGIATVNFDPNGLATRNGADSNTPTWNSGTKICDNIYCHSNGVTADRGSDGTYTWGSLPFGTVTYATTPAWDVGTINTCTPCHPGDGNMNSPYTMVSPGYNTARPSTGSHTRSAHVSNNKTFASYGWTNVQCFWCHNADGANPDGTNYQGTYGTSLHVDGQTYFKPIWYSNGGTMANTLSYSYEGSNAHCGNGKTCW